MVPGLIKIHIGNQFRELKEFPRFLCSLLLMLAAKTTARLFRNMSGQMKISGFFTITPKRAAEDQVIFNHIESLFIVYQPHAFNLKTLFIVN